MRRQPRRRSEMAMALRVLSGPARPPPSTRRAPAFEAALRTFVVKRTEADFQAWRDQRDWTAEKYRRFDRGERTPADWQSVSSDAP